MSWRRTALITGAAAVLVLVATAGAAPELRTLFVVAVAGPLAFGQRVGEPGSTALGLLGLVTAVATGPAAAASTPVMLAWAAPTWAVVLAAAAGLGPTWPPPRNVRARVAVHTAAITSAAVAAPLVMLVTGGGQQGAGWAVAGAVALLAGLLVAAAPGRDR